VAAVMKNLRDDVIEMGYGMSEGFINASRKEINNRFQMMNNHW
jgi:hypothetical protein